MCVCDLSSYLLLWPWSLFSFVTCYPCCRLFSCTLDRHSILLCPLAFRPLKYIIVWCGYASGPLSPWGNWVTLNLTREAPGRGDELGKNMRWWPTHLTVCRGTVALQRMKPLGNLICSSGGGCYWWHTWPVCCASWGVETPSSSHGSLLWLREWVRGVGGRQPSIWS